MGHLRIAVSLLALAACGRATDDLCPEEPRPPWDFENDFDRDAGLLRCERVPELCERPVRSTIAEPDFTRAVDIVFLSDGYRESELNEFHGRATELRAALLGDSRGIVGRDPTLFNFHEVELVSTGAAVEQRALRSCTAAEDSRVSVADMFRVLRAAANAPDADMTIAVVKRRGGWREAVTGPASGAPFIVTDLETTHETVTHEMGHVLVGLADEYSEFPGAGPAPVTQWTTARKEPNLSLAKDETWDGLVSGTVEGGGLFEKGIYRPTERCRMNDQYDRDFCPVCSHAIDEVLASRRRATAGAPRCGVWLRKEGGRLTAFARDPNGISSLTMTLNGMPLGPNVITPDPLVKRLPLHREVDAQLTAGQTFEVTCAGASGASASASLTAQ